jgi:hypothetical protein
VPANELASGLASRRDCARRHLGSVLELAIEILFANSIFHTTEAVHGVNTKLRTWRITQNRRPSFWDPRSLVPLSAGSFWALLVVTSQIRTLPAQIGIGHHGAGLGDHVGRVAFADADGLS